MRARRILWAALTGDDRFPGHWFLNSYVAGPRGGFQYPIFPTKVEAQRWKRWHHEPAKIVPVDVSYTQPKPTKKPTGRG